MTGKREEGEDSQQLPGLGGARAPAALASGPRGRDSGALGYVTQLSSDRAETLSRIQMFFQKKKKRTGERTQIHIFMSASLVYGRGEGQGGARPAGPLGAPGMTSVLSRAR